MPTDPQLDVLLADALPRGPGWRRSRNGNLTMGWCGWRLTVFRRPSGGFGWCVADGRTARYSPGSYPTEKAARVAVVDEVNRMNP